jgi:hypothetical protein
MDVENHDMWMLTGITDIAFDECCLKCTSMQITDTGQAGVVQLQMTSDGGVTVEYLLNDDIWTGHIAVINNAAIKCYIIPNLDGLIDAIMDAKQLQPAARNP